MCLAIPGKIVELDRNAAHLGTVEVAGMLTWKLVAPLEAGQNAAISGHLATLSLQRGQKIYWDGAASK